MLLNVKTTAATLLLLAITVAPAVAQDPPPRWPDGTIGLGSTPGAEGYWQEVERTYAALCGQALARLAPYGCCRLGALLEAPLEAVRIHSTFPVPSLRNRIRCPSSRGRELCT